MDRYGPQQSRDLVTDTLLSSVPLPYFADWAPNKVPVEVKGLHPEARALLFDLPRSLNVWKPGAHSARLLFLSSVHSGACVASRRAAVVAPRSSRRGRRAAVVAPRSSSRRGRRAAVVAPRSSHRGGSLHRRPRCSAFNFFLLLIAAHANGRYADGAEDGPHRSGK